MEKQRIENLLKRIEDSFAGVPRPAITKSVARGLDDEWVLSDERAAELAQLDPEMEWTDLTADDVRNFQEYFTFSDAEGWRFYLPAYMKFYLLGFPDYAWDAVYDACSSRDPKLDLLTASQRACVQEFKKIVDEDWAARR